jgi:hypothetical protein
MTKAGNWLDDARSKAERDHRINLIRKKYGPRFVRDLTE